MNKQITLINNDNAILTLNQISNKNQLCYYLSEDIQGYRKLITKCGDQYEIRNLSGIFEITLSEIKHSLIQLLASLNKEYASNLWWSTPIASRAGPATRIITNITYLFCVKKIILERKNDLIFIVDSNALSNCISMLGKQAGFEIIRTKSRIKQCIDTTKRLAYKIAKGPYFLFRMMQHRRTAFKILKPLNARKTPEKKRVVLRSGFTQSTFDKHGKFKDRNFGPLPARLRSMNYDVWILPMHFNLSMSLNQYYNQLKKIDHQFLIPHHYLTFSDYLNVLLDGYKFRKFRIINANINGINVSPLFNELIRNSLFIPDLCYLLLKRLKERGFEIDAFYYAFESNSHEKLFILACRDFFRASTIYGYQHTTFFPNNLTYHLASGECEYHPLPDKIICSGPMYMELFTKANFPKRILVNGPNLRFENIYIKKNINPSEIPNENRTIMLPLTFSYSLAFDLILKVKEALKDSIEYFVYIRNHPELSKNVLINFLKEIGMTQYMFADEGVIQDWFPRLTAVISSGGSITILEAISYGVPVIRVIPDNSIYLDPFTWSGYPLDAVYKASDICKQLFHIQQILLKDPSTFKDIGEDVKKAYFSKLDPENLKVFL